MVVDLFAGPGGWDIAARTLGLDPLGIENDPAACHTRRAAGLSTWEGDVSVLDPARTVALSFPAARGEPLGLIASPPCQAFSQAGKGEGRDAIPAYTAAIRQLGRGEDVDAAALDAACGDSRAHLVLEPLRWARDLLPQWIALEQVETVLPLWEAVAMALRPWGYRTWTGVLSAEQYGVPQTRRRAFLLAHRDRAVGPPAPTHQRYIAPRWRDPQEEGLFALPDPERIVLPEEEHLLPWVSMAEALGWSPADEVGFPRQADDLEATDDGYRARDLRPAAEPAFALTEKARSWQRFYDRRQVGSKGHLSMPRAASEPAPTIGAQGLAKGRDVWTDSPEPIVGWTSDRPATTVAGDSRVHPPGHKENALDEPGQYEQRRGANAIRVSVQEALVLQSFPPDYPVKGSKSKQYEQVGNAVPPLLARAVLQEVVL